MTDQPAIATTVYSFKPSLLGAPWQFELTDEGLRWRAGRRAGIWPYSEITGVRLSYRPQSIQAYAFRADIESGRQRLRVASTTWQGMLALARQDDAYREFVLELHRRLAPAGATVFVAGLPTLAYGIGVVLFALVAIAMVGLLWRAIIAASWAAIFFLLAIFAVMAWQFGGLLRRNRPAIYEPTAPPAHLLP